MASSDSPRVRIFSSAACRPSALIAAGILGSGDMEQRKINRLGRSVSAIGLGTWQLGADWGEVSADDATAVLETAVAEGVTFFDTADVYGDGRSEGFCAELRRRH